VSRHVEVHTELGEQRRHVAHEVVRRAARREPRRRAARRDARGVELRGGKVRVWPPTMRSSSYVCHAQMRHTHE
jgi:hypothetical protein